MLNETPFRRKRKLTNAHKNIKQNALWNVEVQRKLNKKRKGFYLAWTTPFHPPVRRGAVISVRCNAYATALLLPLWSSVTALPMIRNASFTETQHPGSNLQFCSSVPSLNANHFLVYCYAANVSHGAADQFAVLGTHAVAPPNPLRARTKYCTIKFTRPPLRAAARFRFTQQLLPSPPNNIHPWRSFSLLQGGIIYPTKI